jgi:UDP-3-O-[3-hydroxymyristoyl] glucosamine N-acyltransferase
MRGRERARVLLRVAELIRDNADELVWLESRDVGKPVSPCRAVDVTTAAERSARSSASVACCIASAARPHMSATCWGQVLQSLVERGAHGFHGRQVRAGSAQVAITVTGFGDVRCSVFGLVSAVVEATSHPCG